MQSDLTSLHVGTAAERLVALRNLATEQLVSTPDADGLTNNHIHTFYSFSPYSPTEAVLFARRAGLSSAGIIDHDTMAGAREFLMAGEILDFPVTVGAECRCSVEDTPLAGRRINSPDQLSMAYLVMHAVPHRHIDDVTQFFASVRQTRGLRNYQMTARLNQLIGTSLDYDADIVPLSKFCEGGTLTERHILYALALQLIATYGQGTSLIDYLRDDLHIEIAAQPLKWLSQADNQYLAYDLLGVLKSSLLPHFYLPAAEELFSIAEVIDFANQIDAILAYPYLGDVTSSYTGDKKSQKFEDDYLDELFENLYGLGIRAISYMPSRNSTAQLHAIRERCRHYNMLEISGEDVNSPRQSFICEQLRSKEFAHLKDMTWQLIDHERKPYAKEHSESDKSRATEDTGRNGSRR